MTTLRALLGWAHRAYSLETPNLEHSVSLVDAGGAPQMKPAVQSYLGLAAGKSWLDRDGRWHDPKHDDRPDDWKDAACRITDGEYLTPLRCAIESIDDPNRRLLLRDLVPEVFFPSDIARAHGIPDWCVSEVLYRSLELLRAQWERNERALSEGHRGWISGRSDAQRSAEEAVAAVA